MINEMLAICLSNILPDSSNVVIREPYIPFIPNSWNRILVLAESQNLSSTNDEYVRDLNSLSANERINRLNLGAENVGVYPWDDGSLKLAIEASYDVKSTETAISNSVLWSQRGNSDQNINPEADLQTLSANVWGDLLNILNPSLVICCGKIAYSVIDRSMWNGNKTKLRLPSKTAISRVSGMFDEEDLLIRYPEVNEVAERHPEWLEGGYRRNKIFFACHAVSLNRR